MNLVQTRGLSLNHDNHIRLRERDERERVNRSRAGMADRRDVIAAPGQRLHRRLVEARKGREVDRAQAVPVVEVGHLAKGVVREHESAVQLVAPLLGGLLVAAVGPEWVFVANAASYMVSVVLTWSVRANFADPERDQESAEPTEAC
jgi:Transmembrane secretion effector